MVVGVGDLAVVRIVLGELRRRRVRPMRLVEVQEQEHALRSLLIEPPLGHRLGLGAVALDPLDATVGQRPAASRCRRTRTPD